METSPASISKLISPYIKNARTVANFFWFQQFSYHTIKMHWESHPCLYNSFKSAGRGQLLFIAGCYFGWKYSKGMQRLCWLSTDPELPFLYFLDPHVVMSVDDAVCSFPPGQDSWKLSVPRYCLEKHKMMEFGLGWGPMIF